MVKSFIDKNNHSTEDVIDTLNGFYPIFQDLSNKINEINNDISILGGKITALQNHPLIRLSTKIDEQSNKQV